MNKSIAKRMGFLGIVIRDARESVGVWTFLGFAAVITVVSIYFRYFAMVN